MFSITLNEIENLFLAPEIVEMVCGYLSKVDKKEEIISEIKNLYITDKAGLTFATSKYRMHRHLGEKFGLIKNNTDYGSFKVSIFSELDQMLAVELPDENADIKEILRAYPHKGLVSQVQGKIELSKNGYKNLVLSFLSSDKREDLIAFLKPYLPEIA